MKYFWNKTKGLKADVERHRTKQQELEATIADLEGSNDPLHQSALRVYRHMLYQLHLSKAEVVSKIGRK